MTRFHARQLMQQRRLVQHSDLEATVKHWSSYEIARVYTPEYIAALLDQASRASLKESRNWEELE